MRKPIYSGEPLPIAPRVADPELEAFHRKILDYLRRLTAKLDGSGTGGTGPPGPPGASGPLPTLSLYSSLDFFTSSSWVPIEWNQALRHDAVYDHSIVQASYEIKVLENGFYLFFFDLEFNTGVVFPGEARIVITPPGQPPRYVNMSFGSMYSAGTLSMTVGMPLIQNVAVQIEVRDGGGPADITRAIKYRGMRLNVIKVGVDASGGTSPTNPGSGWGVDPSPPWATPVTP